MSILRDKITELISMLKTKKISFKLIKDEEYKKYLKKQLERSLHKKNTDSSCRVKYLIDFFISTTNPSFNIKIISIGCRNINEIETFKTFGFNDIIGIDLFSNNEKILIMDMHNIEFPDNTFDLIFSSHSLEHSINPEKAVQEIIRIAKIDAFIIIEVPVNYQRNEADLQDFQNLGNLYSLIEKFAAIKKIYFEESLKVGEQNNFCGTDIIRTILQIDKNL